MFYFPKNIIVFLYGIQMLLDLKMELHLDKSQVENIINLKYMADGELWLTTTAQHCKRNTISTEWVLLFYHCKVE